MKQPQDFASINFTGSFYLHLDLLNKAMSLGFVKKYSLFSKKDFQKLQKMKNIIHFFT